MCQAIQTLPEKHPSCSEHIGYPWRECVDALGSHAVPWGGAKEENPPVCSHLLLVTSQSPPLLHHKFCPKSSGIELVKGPEVATFYTCLSAIWSLEDPSWRASGVQWGVPVRPWHLQSSSNGSTGAGGEGPVVRSEA